MRIVPIALAVSLALVVTSCTPNLAAMPAPTPTREPGTLSVVAFLDLSGPRGSLGPAQRDALQLYADQQGSRAVRIKWKTVDVGGSDAKLLIEMRRAVVDEGVDAVVVGTPNAATHSQPFLRAVELAKIPVMLTLPAAEPPVEGGRWLFALAPTPERVAALVAADVRARGSSAVLRFEPRDLETIAATLPSTASALELAGAPRDFAKLAPLVRALVPMPALYFSYLTDPADLGEFRDGQGTAVWPGSRHVVGATPRDQPAARRDFVRALIDKRGQPPTAAATAYDAFGLLASAAERRTAPGSPGLRDRLEMSSYLGIATTYTFGRTSHLGSQVEDFSLLRWDGENVVPAR